MVFLVKEQLVIRLFDLNTKVRKESLEGGGFRQSEALLKRGRNRKTRLPSRDISGNFEMFL